MSTTAFLPALAVLALGGYALRAGGLLLRDRLHGRTAPARHRLTGTDARRGPRGRSGPRGGARPGGSFSDRSV
ncbi:hypothetical protein HDA36_001556 [Nocardiopsis composta]|uniref:Uncharacterized protein n=1 Tax=Nocardiopsis composta TaxID=157465 RepID=A0A7W8VCR0_9ACTN|nr:hypothetical protein [Nocardiopsis composta]